MLEHKHEYTEKEVAILLVKAMNFWTKEIYFKIEDEKVVLFLKKSFSQDVRQKESSFFVLLKTVNEMRAK